MTDPERISKRSGSLAAALLQAAVDEQPSDLGVEQTLAALGVSGVILTTSGAASAAAAGGAKLTSVVSASASGVGLSAAATGGAAKAVTAVLLVKWIGIGVIGGVGLASAAAVVTEPRVASRAQERAPHVSASALQAATAFPVVAAVRPAAPNLTVEMPPVPVPTPVASVSRTSPSAVEPLPAAPPLDVGAPLAAEVAFVDRARSLVMGGQSEQGLLLLQGYEREFPEPRLLPEVLFLRLETCERLGRREEARAAAERLLDGFPQSPHASRARKLLSR